MNSTNTLSSLIRPTANRMASTISLLVCLISVIALNTAAAQTCSVTRDEILGHLKEGVSPIELAEKYKGCTSADTNDKFVQGLAIAATTKADVIIKNTGNTYWEAITACGYHPQRKELACPVEIRRPWGYGGPPALQPAGSFEYVQFCIGTPAGLVPVNGNGFHVHDAVTASPAWQFAAVIPADVNAVPNLFSMPLVGTTLRARAILSWAIPPLGNCNFLPIWGNQIDFKIRLDP